jgi:hypothetical protein
MHGRGHPVDVVPVLGDDLVPDAAAKHRGESGVVDALLGAVDHLVREIAEPEEPNGETAGLALSARALTRNFASIWAWNRRA